MLPPPLKFPIPSSSREIGLGKSKESRRNLVQDLSSIDDSARALPPKICPGCVSEAKGRSIGAADDSMFRGRRRSAIFSRLAGLKPVQNVDFMIALSNGNP